MGRRHHPQVVRQSVPALCAVVEHLTKDVRCMVWLLSRAFAFLDTRRQQPVLSDPERATARRSLLVASLTAQHYNFDGHRDAFPADSPVLTRGGSSQTAFAREAVYGVVVAFANRPEEQQLLAGSLEALGTTSAAPFPP
jgi:hypothetical protein